MDAFKRDTVKDYTAWVLNCARFVRIKKRQALETIFKRKTRRRNKQFLRQHFKNQNREE